MAPEVWKAVGEAITYIVLGAGGLFAAQRVQSRIGSPDPDHEAESAVLERIEAKLDRMAGSLRGIKVEVDDLSEDVQRQRGELTRLASNFRDVAGRVEVLESRMTRPM